MRFFLIKILVFLSISLGCTQKRDVYKEYFENEVIFLSDSTSAYLFTYIDTLNGTEYLIASNVKPYSIDLFNLSNKVLEHRIRIPFFFEGYYVKSLDSIYVMEYETNEISLFNSGGELINRYSFDDLISNEANKFITSSMQGSHLINIDDKFFFNIVSQVWGAEFYSDPTIGIFDYINNDFIKTGFFPVELQNNRTFLSFYPFYCKGHNDLFIYSFAVSHELFVYKHNSKLLKKVNAQSKYIDSFEPIPEEQNYQQKYSAIYEHTRNRYSVLLFDKYRNLYYRVTVHSQEYFNEDGSINQYGSNPWSIIIMDAEFNIIDEVMMEPNKYRIEDILVCKKGLLLRLNEESMASVNGLEYQIMMIEVKQ